MTRSDSDLATAAAYLRNNVALRRALGVADGEELVPHFLGTGEHNRNFRFSSASTGKSYVLRINVAPQPFHKNQVAYEFAALQALAPSGRAPQPLYLDDSPTAPGKGALVISFCEGKELNFDALRPGDLARAAQLMADVHAVPVPADTPLHRPHDPLRSLFDECLQRFELYRVSAFEDARITRWAERFIAAARPLVDAPTPEADRTHIVNTETLPSHFLLPERAACETVAMPNGNQQRQDKLPQPQRLYDEPGFFVDWERPIIGEVAQDVAYFVSPTTTFWDSDFLFPASGIEGFLELYWRAVDGRFERGSFDERFRAWRMMTALRSVTWCCKALITYGPTLGTVHQPNGLAPDSAGHSSTPQSTTRHPNDAAGAHSTTPARDTPREDAAYTTQKTMQKLPVYLSDDFMEMLASECFDL